VDIGIAGGGVNGLCCAWVLQQQGHTVHLYERDRIVAATSSASSKLLHGGLRYLENREFRLVREALRERDAWLERVPQLTRPLRLVLPVYDDSRRPRWMMGIGLFLYDRLAGKAFCPHHAGYRPVRFSDVIPPFAPKDLRADMSSRTGRWMTMPLVCG
jgi:glycerol-3-phosphate dehydrogenase